VSILVAIAVHFICGMASCAGKSQRGIMHISRDSGIFPLVFHSYAASVTGGAVFRHVRHGHESMPLNEATAYGSGTADMALATGCMAFIAIGVEMLFHVGIRVDIESCATSEKRPVAAESGMKRIGRVFDYIGMARGATPAHGWVGDHAGMRFVHRENSRHTAMTSTARLRAMGRFKKQLRAAAP